MRNKLIKIGTAFMAVVVLVSMLAMPSSAYVAFNSYNFDYYGTPVETPSGYAPEKVYYAQDMGLSSLENAIDMHVSPDNEIYIIDYVGTDNDAYLHILDSNFKLTKTLSTLKYKGKDYKMRLPESVTVDKEGYIYICDTGNSKVIKLDKDKSGNIIQIIGAPTSDIFSGEFKPSKLAIAKNKSLYVISSGTLDGIIEFNEKGTFLRFFGAPDVELSVMDMVTMAWRRMYRSLLGHSASQNFVTFIPTEFVNLVVDDYGFVYSVIGSVQDNTNQLKKLNFQGKNILDPNAKSTKKVSTTLSETFGDLVRRTSHGQNNVFKDVGVDDDGFITMLDTNLRKVFEYDAEGNMTFVYGTMGDQEGLFNKPVALAKLGKKTLVLDNHFGCITVFDLTQYGRTLHQAVVLYDKGLYDQAEEYWVEVLKSNANCELAHIGIAKVYYQYSRYEDALNHFKIANDRGNYESAFTLYREAVIADYFDLIMTSLVILIILAFVWKFFGKKIIQIIKDKKQGGEADDDAELME